MVNIEITMLIVFLLNLLLSISPPQEENFWHVLAQVSFRTSIDVNGYEVETPVFSNHLKSFQGKKIKLRGYMVPLNEVDGKKNYMVSAFPFNACYFCGAAGPETVVQIETSQKIEFTENQITIEGVLFLNSNDTDHHIYILKSAILKR
jgi:hypothetical protein